MQLELTIDNIHEYIRYNKAGQYIIQYKIMDGVKEALQPTGKENTITLFVYLINNYR
jgi:hypothetical protein